MTLLMTLLCAGDIGDHRCQVSAITETNVALVSIKIATQHTNESENVNYSGWNEQLGLISRTLEKTRLRVHCVKMLPRILKTRI